MIKAVTDRSSENWTTSAGDFFSEKLLEESPSSLSLHSGQFKNENSMVGGSGCLPELVSFILADLGEGGAQWGVGRAILGCCLDLSPDLDGYQLLPFIWAGYGKKGQVEEKEGMRWEEGICWEGKWEEERCPEWRPLLRDGQREKKGTLV